MTTTVPAAITDILQRQRDFWATGVTRDLDFRMAQLKRLREAIVAYQEEIVAAAMTDLGRPAFEGYFEVGAISELDYVIKHFRSWAKPRKTSLPLSQRPGSAWVQPEPLGVVLVIAPGTIPFS